MSPKLSSSLFIKTLSVTLSLFVAGFSLVTLIQPIAAQATAAGTQVTVTLNVTSQISISSDSGTQTMTPALGVSSSQAVGTSTFTVITNDGSGYTLALTASTSPAMSSGGNKIPDYATSGPTTWSVGSGASAFGFSAYGTDVNTTTWGNSSPCNGSGANIINPTLKFFGFGTSAVATSSSVASRTSTTTPTGVSTTVCYAAAQGTAYFIPAGTYTATITATATAS